MTRAIAEADALRARTWYAQERARLVLSRASSPPLHLHTLVFSLSSVIEC